MDAMKEMNDNAFDLAIVDPPYGINMAKLFTRNGKNKSKYWKNYPLKDWDECAPNQLYFDELFRVSQNQIIWGGNYFIDKIKKPSQGWIVWNKGQRNFKLADGEIAWTSFDRAIRILDLSRGKARSENRKTNGMFHPTKKPVSLYEWILDKYAKPDWKILDTHIGSGSIAIACHDLGFDLTGYEIDSDYYNDCMKRLNEHQRQLKLWK
jgi:site-specific DNA-methyltransferase (adenine-specific)